MVLHSLRASILLLSHNGEDSATWSPNRGKTWNAKVNGAGWQTQTGLLAALRSEGGQEGKRPKNDEMKQIFPIARDHWWEMRGC